MLREQVDVLREGMRRRGVADAITPVIDRGERLERERRELIQAVDERKAQRNANAQDVARRKRAGGPADDLIAHGRALGDAIARLESEPGATEAELQTVLFEIPNVTLAPVPEGGEERSVIIREWG